MYLTEKQIINRVNAHERDIIIITKLFSSMSNDTASIRTEIN